MLIGIFDNKQKKKKVNKKENVHETKKELTFYYNTIYIKDNSLNEELIMNFKECGYKNKSDYLNLLIKKGLESKRKEKRIRCRNVKRREAYRVKINRKQRIKKNYY